MPTIQSVTALNRSLFRLQTSERWSASEFYLLHKRISAGLPPAAGLMALACARAAVLNSRLNVPRG